VETLEDRCEFDLAHLFGGPDRYRTEDLEKLRDQRGGTVEPDAVTRDRMAASG
jgi:hypothetical protein